MKEIPLTRGKVALVDDQDYDFLMQWKWYTSPRMDLWYARRWDGKKDGKRVFVLMHRLILGLTDNKIFVDHIDGDGLNNQRKNIRPCTQSQNCMNRKINSAKFQSKYLGVYYRNDKRKKQWRALIHKEGKRYDLGHFATESEAALAYNLKKLEMFGEFAKLNVII